MSGKVTDALVAAFESDDGEYDARYNNYDNRYDNRYDNGYDNRNDNRNDNRYDNYDNYDEYDEYGTRYDDYGSRTRGKKSKLAAAADVAEGYFRLGSELLVANAKTPPTRRGARYYDNASAGALVGWEDIGGAWAADETPVFLGKLALLSVGLAALVKYAPYYGLPPATGLSDSTTSAIAAAVIIVPSGLNIAKWLIRSQEDAEFVGDF